MKPKYTVVLSGGQDSTTCLYWALDKGVDVQAVTFHYDQRHDTEVEAAKRIAAHAGVPHTVLEVPGLGVAGKGSSLTRDLPLDLNGGFQGLPSSFLPGRNLVFLSLAASFAIPRDSFYLVTGVCQTDYSGYPDCRRSTIDAMEKAINLGNDLHGFYIDTPLMHLTKAETVRLMKGFGNRAWEALGMSITCYEGKHPGCGACAACVLRKKGFSEAGFDDPAGS